MPTFTVTLHRRPSGGRRKGSDGAGSVLFRALFSILACAALSGCATEEPRSGEESPASGASGSTDPPLAAAAEADWVGSETCAECHPAETALWSGSHHDLAMQEATEETVLASFDDETFVHQGTTTSFFRRDDGFWVRTTGETGETGATGQPVEVEVRYTFGVTPLQQYLVDGANGRLQVLPFCWDSRPRREGGARWFHLYPDEEIPPGDVLHWTGPNQTWNHMCAECHSTNLEKGYDPESDSYETTWEEIDVACEACHGPASSHVEQARAPGPDRAMVAGAGLFARLREDDEADWIMDTTTGIATRGRPRETRTQITACARCHARRGVIGGYRHGADLLDTHMPSLLTPELYHADGQILDEVYVWGSFVQSRMYRAGVTCSDCHDPHSLEVRGEGNAACAGCHLPQRFDTTEHHFHEPGTPGAACVECHMPASTYMVVDPRRDHSLRVPRPDLTSSLGTPNACNGCHEDRSPEWAATAIRDNGDGEAPPDHFATALAAARAGRPRARDGLLRWVRDDEAPGIVRATALELLRDLPSGPGLPSELGPGLLREAVNDPDPLVRVAAARAAETLSPELRVEVLARRLEDPVRGVRIETARALATVAPSSLPNAIRPALEAALDEYVSAQASNLERPEAHLNLALLHTLGGRPGEAEAEYRKALELGPHYLPTYVNLADLYRALGRDDEGEAVLRAGLGQHPENGDLHHSLGLLLVRRGNTEDAIAELQKAVAATPDSARYGYVLGVAFDSVGRTGDAISALETTLERAPGDYETLAALVSFRMKSGDVDGARRSALDLVEHHPGDADARRLLAQIERAAGQ